MDVVKEKIEKNNEYKNKLFSWKEMCEKYNKYRNNLIK